MGHDLADLGLGDLDDVEEVEGEGVEEAVFVLGVVRNGDTGGVNMILSSCSSVRLCLRVGMEMSKSSE